MINYLRLNKTGKRKKRCQGWFQGLFPCYREVWFWFLGICQDIEIQDYYTGSYKTEKIQGVDFVGLKAGHDFESMDVEWRRRREWNLPVLCLFLYSLWWQQEKTAIVNSGSSNHSHVQVFWAFPHPLQTTFLKLIITVWESQRSY